MLRMSIWVAGDCDDPSLRDAVTWLREHFDCQVVPSEWQSSSAPIAILFVHAQPGAIAAQTVETLHRLAPHATLIVLAGCWSDGELSSCRALPGVVRIRWHEWQWRLSRELRLSSGPRLPRTATEGDRLEHELALLSRHEATGGRIAIYTDCRLALEGLVATCGAIGYRAHRPENVDTNPCEWPVACLIDGWSHLPAGPAEVPQILLLDFPRPEDFSRAADLGLAAVLAKPLAITNLAAALDYLASAGAISAATPSVT